MTRPAHPPALTPAPPCLGCGQPMQATSAGHWTCAHDDTQVDTYDLPRGDDTLQPNHVARRSSAPWAGPPDRGPLVLRPGIGDNTRGRQT